MKGRVFFTAIKTKALVDTAVYKGFCPGAPRGTPIMGEEKPDEELMGKRKSSPRLSTTFIDVDTSRMPVRQGNIRPAYKKMG
ncbi:hypothetical protein CHH75_06790 [Paenibacillus sp. 7541]|uniref:Uncharacterized protein n=1 Tax=Paenibacillus campinasensis TaxID=66347 RepID=A0A268ERK8_9BACL|nr:hypothetical protein CHH67_13955 [Paenibacillus campinasensis]PAK54555.1 hypothetical protein CHH75_06790 [Paenibacillus sp. 7541]